MNKKGFTLVELLVVITIIGLLVVIAVPASLTISKKVKAKMYDSKIELIEKEAILWGQENKNKLNSTTTTDSDLSACTENLGGSITTCKKVTLGFLLTENALESDDKTEDFIKNPTTDGDMQDCQIEIYIKNKRVYAEYDKTQTGQNCQAVN